MIKRFVRNMQSEEPLGVDEFAKSIGKSREHFSKTFLRKASLSPSAFSVEVRLLKAATNLRTTTLSVLCIALESGWDSESSFARAFKNRFAVNPKTYRKEKAMISENTISY